MKKEYNAMFDMLVPQKSDEELLRAVLSGKADIMNENKKRKRKAIIIPALVAAALCATTIGVSAAYNWSISAAIQDIFGKRAENSPQIVDDRDIHQFDFEVLGIKELSDVIDCGKYRIALKGVAADKYTAFIMYDLVFDENFDYELENDGEQWRVLIDQTNSLDWMAEMFDEQGNDDLPTPMGYSYSGFLGMEGNIAHCYTEITQGIPLQGNTMNLKTCPLYRLSPNSEYEKVDDGGITFSITFDFDTEANVKTLEPNAPIFVEGFGTGKLTYLSVSPFELALNIDWDDPAAADFIKDRSHDEPDVIAKTLKVTFKDGIEKDITAFDRDTVTDGVECHDDRSNLDDTGVSEIAKSSMFPHWNYPVNINDIVSVSIGGQTFQIN